MPLQSLRTVAKPQNGVGAFILQCKRLSFHYCDWAGSSRGMNAFLKHHLPAFAKANPGIEIVVSPRPGKHPVIKGGYVNGREKAVCVRSLEAGEVLGKAELLKGANGERLRVERGVVRSGNEGVRGMWSPFHAGVGRGYKI
ncbi:39S ribosomal protein L51, mitochondrial [Recurvomyces mirabilis]|nr:39S ribosomal protein L51, mitochondrial [Recurvomyces mirabilis]